MYWPLDQALHTDVNYILLAKVGHENMLRMIFGSGDSTTPKGPPKGADGKPLTLTPAAFDAIFPDKPQELVVRVKR